jgi:hypothetical protein
MMIASELRQGLTHSRACQAAYTGYTSASAQEYIATRDSRDEQTLAVVEELVPLGRAAVEIGCTFIGSDLTPAELVELVTGMTAALLAAPARPPAFSPPVIARLPQRPWRAQW